MILHLALALALAALALAALALAVLALAAGKQRLLGLPLLIALGLIVVEGEVQIQFLIHAVQDDGILVCFLIVIAEVEGGVVVLLVELLIRTVADVIFV